jgi:HlyD family secretion protein
MELFRKYAKLIILCILFCTGCSDSNEHILPGYIEGEYTYIASGVAGTLFKLYVVRGQPIKIGDPLYQLDPEPEKASVEISRDNIADLESQVEFYKIQLQRQRVLYLKNAGSKASLDQAQTDYNTKAQQLSADKSQLIETEWSLQQKMQYSPVNGEVFDTFYRIGEKVQENHAVLALLAPENIKVLFYLPETLLSQIKLGQTITFSCDNCNAKTQATISYISPEAEYTPPVIYSKDTRYKLVYLIRADMPKDIALKFHPGQPIDVYINHE